MFAQTAKGFHVHPPSIPDGTGPEEWMHRLFIEETDNYGLRRYSEEQWDVMFFVQGVAEMILCDVRAGLPRRTMRFFVDGDNHPGREQCWNRCASGRSPRHSGRRFRRRHHGLRNEHLLSA